MPVTGVPVTVRVGVMVGVRVAVGGVPVGVRVGDEVRVAVGWPPLGVGVLGAGRARGAPADIIEDLVGRATGPRLAVPVRRQSSP